MTFLFSTLELTHVHWLQYRRIFGLYSHILQLRCVVENDRFSNYTAVLRNTVHDPFSLLYRNQTRYISMKRDGEYNYVIADSWRSTLKIDFRDVHQREVASAQFPVIKLTRLIEPVRFNINGKVFKLKICSALVSELRKKNFPNPISNFYFQHCPELTASVSLVRKNISITQLTHTSNSPSTISHASQQKCLQQVRIFRCTENTNRAMWKFRISQQSWQDYFGKRIQFF